MHADAHALEYAIMAVYLAVTFGFALYYGRRLGREDTAGCFLAGRAPVRASQPADRGHRRRPGGD
ncbi:MAG: hypothetical protein GVX90_03510 [Alphaproteobacteria bacterium]|jgi:hypothetical protein|nr:hypothetical protein [Alphaproteobacteria bacterium]